MIVVDTNVVVYLLLQGDLTREARAVLARDSDWVSSTLLIHELRNLLARQVREDHGRWAKATEVLERAHALVRLVATGTDDRRVLDAAVRSGCTAYDCEFVALAEELGVPLVTTDRQVLRAFPGIAVAPDRFTGQRGRGTR